MYRSHIFLTPDQHLSTFYLEHIAITCSYCVYKYGGLADSNGLIISRKQNVMFRSSWWCRLINLSTEWTVILKIKVNLRTGLKNWVSKTLHCIFQNVERWSCIWKIPTIIQINLTHMFSFSCETEYRECSTQAETVPSLSKSNAPFSLANW